MGGAPSIVAALAPTAATAEVEHDASHAANNHRVAPGSSMTTSMTTDEFACEVTRMVQVSEYCTVGW